MTTGLPEPFPSLRTVETDDHNPAIRLFGKRFIGEQSALELLAEFLAVAFCEKRITETGRLSAPLPDLDDLSSWPSGASLQYRPSVKLNLKLFAFLRASRIDTRHHAHKEHYEKLVKRLVERIRTGDGNARDVIDWLEELLHGFQGAGFNRAWCAQVFFPITPAFLTKETIWSNSVARRDGVDDWETVIEGFSRYFSLSRRDFLARGGELLYLQLCNALATDPSALGEYVEHLRRFERSLIAEEEADPKQLHRVLSEGLSVLKGQRSAAFERLIDAIENLDPETKAAVNQAQGGESGWLACEWCPRESWQEGYLFAIEQSRVLRAMLDPVERIEMLTVGCALQVLRSLCAQSARYANIPRADAPLGYTWLIAPPEGASKPLQLASQRNLQVVQGLIQGALRTPALFENARRDSIAVDRLYREADTKYGHKLFLSLGKKLGLVVPKRGPAARFTMTDDILRYLVLALLRPGERCTYDTFLKRLHLHYGIAVEGGSLSRAAIWSGLPASQAMQPGDRGWLAASLRAGGFLVELSDACSIVRNTYVSPDDMRSGGVA